MNPASKPRPRIDKTKLVAALRKRSAQADAVHDELRQEDPKDTRAIEAQYIARGLSQRVEELQRSVATLSGFRCRKFGPDDPVAASALVGLDDGETEKVFFLVPVAGGETLETTKKNTAVQTLTPKSPLGHALCDKFVDDDVEVDLPGRRVVATIAWVE